MVLGIAAVVGGILALALQRLTITLTTAFLGAWGVVIGTTHVTGGTSEATTLPEALLPTANDMQTAFWWWLGLAVLGTVVQYRWSRKQVARRPSAAAA